MREILFRGKSEDTGEWLEGDLFINARRSTYYYIRHKMPNDPLGINYTHDRVVAKTVGQFTGMLDKNKKKIFEGDIILYANSYLYEVFWSSDELQYRIREVGVGDMDHLSNLFESATEIIGNIHDNPEMLKEN